MIKYLNSTVFNSGCDGLVNTINCVGTMGAGLALEFALRYPDMEKSYKLDCASNKVKTGEILTYRVSENILIINFPVRSHWKFPSKLEWIAAGLDYLKKHYKEWDVKSIALPPLGGDDGLNFEMDVKPLIISMLSDIAIDVFICKDPGYAEGKEKEMLEAFNNTDKHALCDELKITGNSRKSLLSCGKIKRFHLIKNLENIGIHTYKKIFICFYNGRVIYKTMYKQQSLFDF